MMIAVTNISSHSRRWIYPLLGSLVFLTACLLFAATSAAQDVVQTIAVNRPGGATQSFIVSTAPSPAVPTFIVILLPGGDGNINLNPTTVALPVTATSVASNVLTVTVSNTLAVGQQVYMQGTAESFLNGQLVTVSSLIGAGPPYTGFTGNFAASNYSNASDSGSVSLTPSGFGLNVGSSNFLVRSRWLFAGQGFYVITLDSATDFQASPAGLVGQQGSANHIIDVLQVIAWARSQQPGIPVWVVGTSRGTAGAFVAGQYFPSAGGPDGLVFSDSVNTATDPDSVLMASLGSIIVPVLLFHDNANTCPVTPASQDSAVRKQLTASPLVATEAAVGGGLVPLEAICNGLSDEGFFGAENSAVSKIAAWIAAAPVI